MSEVTQHHFNNVDVRHALFARANAFAYDLLAVFVSFEWLCYEQNESSDVLYIVSIQSFIESTRNISYFASFKSVSAVMKSTYGYLESVVCSINVNARRNMRMTGYEVTEKKSHLSYATFMLPLQSSASFNVRWRNAAAVR